MKIIWAHKISLMLFFASTHALAANWSAPSDDKLGVKFGFSVPSLSVAANPNKELADQNVEYNPNSSSNTFLSFAYQNVGFSVSRVNPLKEEEIQTQGETELSDYQLRFYGKYASTEFFYQKYQGYFIKNSEDIDPAYAGSKNRILRPDLSTEHWGMQLLYNFHPDDFNIGAAFDQFNRQTSSGGSWLGLVYADHHKIHADTPWVPASISAGFPTSANFNNGIAVSAGVGGGYGFCLTAGNFYLSGILAVGFGSQQQHYTGITGDDFKVSRSASKFIIRPALGYNGENNYAGLQAIIDSANYEFSQSEGISFTATEISFFYGHRFEGVNIPPLAWISDLID